MYDSKCHEGRKFKTFISLEIFLITILMIFFLVPYTEAGYPVGDQVHFYDVGMTNFSVVWQVSEPSDYCTVLVYSDNSASPTLVGDYTPTPWDGAEFGIVNAAKAQERGLMQVTITGLSMDTTYYIQTRSSETGSPNVFYDFPGFSNLLSVKTAPLLTGSPPENGTIVMFLYETDINPSAPTENLLADAVLAIVSVDGGDYPVSSTATNGWPADDVTISLDLGPLLKGTAYYDLSSPSVDRDITIMCFGGLVPDVGVGQRIIETTFPASMIGVDEGCLPDTANIGGDGFECFGDTFNQIALITNRSPEIVLTPAGPYTAERGAPFSVEACASDPDGDLIDTFSLIKNPAGMDITQDANCATITWTPSACVDDVEVEFTVKDDQGNSSETAFTISIRRCPPYPPSASIAPPSPTGSDDLVCTAVSGGDPDNDPVKFVFKWICDGCGKDPVTHGPKSDLTDTLASDNIVKGESWTCEVTAQDDNDGSSAPFIAGPVNVGNSPPSAPGSAVVTPDDPLADQDLICAITAATDPDNEGLQYLYSWTCTNCDDQIPINHGPKSELTDILPSDTTDKSEQWSCEVLARDGTANGPSINSNVVTIADKPPTAPGDVQIVNTPPVLTGDDLTCTVGTPSTDPDGDDVYYVFRWFCQNCTKDPIERAPKPVDTSDSDTLASSNTAKGEEWACEVWAQDQAGEVKSSSETTSFITIENTPPEGLTTVDVTPDTAYVNNNLTCTAGTVTDVDEDAISYTFQWNCTECGGKTIEPRTSSETSDILLASNTAQGETWSCEVTAKDTSDAQISATSNQVPIENRPPVITTDPTVETQVWDEGGAYTIQINVSDPDGNNFTLEIDTNYVDPDDPDVSEWLSYENNILTANPPFGSSSLNLGDGEGILKFNFIVEETDGTPNNRVERSVTATIRFPAITVDDFEYTATKPTLAQNGWYKLQGKGNMLLKQEDPNDPNSNHYLKTTVTGTPTNNSQINYIIYKTIPANSPFDNAYPVIQFSVNDKNLYYFDAFVRSKNNADVEKNFFLRYIPQDPNDVGWEYKVSGNYVRFNIGEQSIDPNGAITEIERNMDTDLFNATGYHYLYLKGIVLRGDIDFVDDIKVRSAPPPKPLMDVVDLEAQGNENQVTLQWTLPPDQADNIAGYNIYMDANNTEPTKDEAFYIATVDPDKTSYTKTGLANGVTYCFRVTAIDNLLTPNETEGVTACGTPTVTVPLAPIDLMLSSKDSTIELTWWNPANQHPDLAGYMIYYCDCVSGDCSACYAEFVDADNADPNGRFLKYITKDENQEFLQYGNTYDFTVKAKDTAQPANLSDGISDSIRLEYPTAKSVDNFDYEAGQTLMDKGWYRLQGKGSFTRKVGVGINNYLAVKGPNDYMVVKWLTNPQDFKNPNLSMDIRSLGNFRIDAYVKGKDKKNYFLSYKGDKNAEEDSPDAIVEQKRFFVYTIGWKNKVSTEWYNIERDLNEDLLNAKEGIEFDMLLGIILRGTLDIDNVELGEGIPGAENLTARPGDSSVLLSWTLADPNKIDETRIYVDGSLDANIVTSLENDYQHEVTGLANGTTYEFKVAQVAGEDESKGVSVSATPMLYKAVFTFDTQADLNEWSLTISDGVGFDVVYDSGVQSNVMYLNPDTPNPDRGYYAYKGMDISDVTGMTCRIKTSSNFSIWLSLENPLVPAGLPFMLGFVPGGTAGTYSHYYSPFGDIAYYFLGPGYTDGNWHYLDLNLDDVMGIITGSGIEKIEGIYFGGKIYVDDVSIY